MTTRRRFRLDSATAEDVALTVCQIDSFGGSRRYVRAARLLLHWWALGHDPARALRCPCCLGIGCGHCSGRGWSLPRERGTP